METLDLFSQTANPAALAGLAALPERILTAVKLAAGLPLPSPTPTRQVLLLGHATGLDAARMLEGLLKNDAVFKGQAVSLRSVPAWARGEETLIVFLLDRPADALCLSQVRAALAQGCQTVVLCSGDDRGCSNLNDALIWQVNYPVAARRQALPELFWAGYTLFARLGWLAGAELTAGRVSDLLSTVWQKWGPQSPVHQNPAKRQAGQLCGRGILVVSGEGLFSAASRWRSAFAQSGKNWAQFESLSSLCEELLEGIVNPEDFAGRMVVLFLRCGHDSPHELQQSALLQEFFMVAALGTDAFTAPGETVVECLWSSVLFAEVTAIYLSALNQVDAGAFPATDAFEAALAGDE